MNSLIKFDDEYKNWLTELKSKIQSAQAKAALTVNSQLIALYWQLGKMIAEKQSQTKWGDKLIDKIATDLKTEFANIGGLSASNLKYCKRFYAFYQSQIGQQPVDLFAQQLVAQIPWGHNIHIFSKAKNLNEAQFYLKQTIENGWSRDVLALQIKTNLYERQGSAVNNFQTTLPEPISELARQTLKDPYVFDFLTLAEPIRERDVENLLIAHITKFLLELGKGFAFVGRQVKLEIGENEYFLDLLFYHIRLKCYVVVEVKNVRFVPEHAGKLNFYLSAVDSLMKDPTDNPTIGVLLCREKNNIEVEFALRDMNKPMGVSEFQFTEILPENLKSALPTIEEIENELNSIDFNPATA